MTGTEIKWLYWNLFLAKFVNWLEFIFGGFKPFGTTVRGRATAATHHHHHAVEVTGAEAAAEAQLSRGQEGLIFWILRSTL